jgi:hypothetical protein
VSSGSINGHANARGFTPSSWPSRRGMMSYYYYPRYGMAYCTEYAYQPKQTQGLGRQVMAKDTGWVFWGANYQNYGPYAPYTGYYYRGQFVYSGYYNYGNGYGGLGIYGFDADVGGAVADFTKSGWTSTSTSPYALLCHIEVSRKGEQLVFEYIPNSSTHYRNQESIRWVRNIHFDESTGALDSGYDSSTDAGDFESYGRAGESYSVITGGRDIFYAFRSGSSNENQKYFTRQRWDPNTATWTKTQVTNSTGSGRISVLWSGR